MMRAARFSRPLAVLVAVAVPFGAALAEESSAPSSSHEPSIARQDWSFNGVLGKFDRAQLQRGYHVYSLVCANCHSTQLLSYRNLGEDGGPQFSKEAVEILASKAQVTDGPNEKGEMFKRPARPSDRFPPRFANDQLARMANSGALPPDLSVMAKARPAGPDYIYALLTGYKPASADMKMTPGMHYNTAFPGHQIAMPPPLVDGVVPYTDGTKKTVDNYAKDVSAYLMWAAEPKLEERHSLGAQIMIFLIVFAVIMFLAKRAVWSRMH
jgi:cytochrome c1